MGPPKGLTLIYAQFQMHELPKGRTEPRRRLAQPVGALLVLRQGLAGVLGACPTVLVVLVGLVLAVACDRRCVSRGTSGRWNGSCGRQAVGPGGGNGGWGGVVVRR